MVVYRPGPGGRICILKPAGGKFTVVYEDDNGILRGSGFVISNNTSSRLFAFDYAGTGRRDHLVVYTPGGRAAGVARRTPADSADPFAQVYSSHSNGAGDGIGTYDMANAHDQLFPLDLNGTGFADHLVAYRPGTGTVWILEKDATANPNLYKPVLASQGIGGYPMNNSADRLMAYNYGDQKIPGNRPDRLVAYRPFQPASGQDSLPGLVWILEKAPSAPLTYTPIFQSGDPASSTGLDGIGGYDLADINDQVTTFDYDDSGRADHLVLYRPGKRKCFILESPGGDIFMPVYRAPTVPIPVTVGLMANISSYQLDPYPDYKPSQLIKLSGATAAEQYCISTQDVTTSGWATDKVRMPAKVGTDPHLVSRYVANATLFDTTGAAMAGRPVTISAGSLVEVTIGKISYQIGPGRPIAVATDSLGKLVISVDARGLNVPVIYLNTDGLSSGSAIDFTAPINDYLAGTGTIASQKGAFSADALANAECTDANGDKAPLVADWSKAPLNADQVVDHCTQVYGMAAGTPPQLTAMIEGFDEPQPIVGYVIQKWDSSRPGYQVFHTTDELAAYRAYRDTHPAYGGWWESFTNWASDVWEGIKTGAAQVAEVIVHAAEAVVEIVVQVGNAIVSLGQMIVDAIEQAVQAVEAVFQMIADAVNRVIDWLKSLFDFQDIWNTKKALQAGVSQVVSYGISTIEHVGSLADNWFQQREAEITQLFDELKSRYGGKRLGDFQNETPGLTDSSGAAVDKNNLRDNPQANWMTNQVVGGAASHAESAPAILQDSPIIAAFQTMVDSFDSSSISDDLAKALGDIETLAKSLFDPDNANAADGAATIAILDLLEHLILAVLKAIDGLTHALFTFLSSSAQAVVDWFNTPLEGYGLLSALYDWVRPDGEPKTDMTAADLFFLTVAFFVTVIYKLINGVDHPPFPSGTFPAIPAPPWHKDYDPEFVADDPASYNQDMAIVQIACGACGIVAAFVEFGTDVAPATPILEGADTNFWLALAELVFSTVMFNVVSNCPPIGGDAWATETEVPGFYVATPATGVFAMACITFVLQGATVIVNRVKPDLAKSPIMKNVFDGKGGPIINTIISSISLGCMAASCAQTSANPYSSAQNTIQFIPGVLQVVRLKVSDTDESYPWRCLIIGVIDLLCNLTSAIMTVIGAATSAFTQRVAISAQQFQPAQVGMTYSEAVQYSGANATYNAPPQKWTVRTGQLPSGLNLNPQTGKIEGVPTLVTGTTPASFTVRCTDSFGPPQYSDDSTALQLSVNPSIVGSLAFTNSQASQSTPVSTVGLGQPLVVTVMSNQTTPQPVVGAGVLVTLPAAVNGASATFYADGTSSTILTTGSDGTVTIPDFVTNAYTGQWSVTAAVPGIGAATATYLITNASSPVASIVPGTGATPQSILGPDVLPPGPGVFPYAITATLNDKNGNPVPNTVVTFTETGASMNKNHWYGWFQSNYQTSMTVTSDQNGNVSAGTFSNKYQGGAPYPLPVPLYVLTGPFSITAAVPGSPAKTEYKLTNRPKST